MIKGLSTAGIWSEDIQKRLLPFYRDMDSVNRMAFRLQACRTCGGDSYLDMWDLTEWRCLQCGRPVSEEPVTFQARRPVDVPKAA